LRGIERLELHPRVTFLVGENGSGKSTTYVEELGVSVFVLDADGIDETPYDETDMFELTRSFLADRSRLLRHLFA
jgi:predicted ATPase